MAETKVILTKSVNHLGHPGDVVAVKSGYARATTCSRRAWLSLGPRVPPPRSRP